MLIEPVKATQAAELAALHLASFGNAAWSLSQVQDSLALSSTVGFVATDQGIITGFVLLQSMVDEAEILTFCVDPPYRRQKIGEQLLQYAMQALPGKNLFLEVAADNNAASELYQKLGFELIGKRPNYYKRDKGLIDALMFQLHRFA